MGYRICRVIQRARPFKGRQRRRACGVPQGRVNSVVTVPAGHVIQNPVGHQIQDGKGRPGNGSGDKRTGVSSGKPVVHPYAGRGKPVRIFRYFPEDDLPAPEDRPKGAFNGDNSLYGAVRGGKFGAGPVYQGAAARAVSRKE